MQRRKRDDDEIWNENLEFKYYVLLGNSCSPLLRIERNRNDIIFAARSFKSQQSCACYCCAVYILEELSSSK